MWEKLKSWLGKPAQLFVAAWERILSPLKKQATAWGVFALLVGCILYFWSGTAPSSQSSNLWDESGSVRTLIFALGLAGAFLGAWLASIRNENFAKQVDTQTKQTRSEILGRSIQQISHEKSSAIRTAGIRGLEFLAQDNKNDMEFLKQVCGILQDFLDEWLPFHLNPNTLEKLRKIENWSSSWNIGKVIKEIRQAAKSMPGTRWTKSEETELRKCHKSWRDKKAEVRQAIHSFGRIVAIAPKTLRGPDLPCRYLLELHIFEKEAGQSSLRGANLSHSFLPGAHLWNVDLTATNFLRADLRGANLQNTDLRGARLLATYLRGAYLWISDLRGADLGGTDLRKADFMSAKMQKTIFRITELEGANFVDTKLAGAIYYETQEDYFQDMATNRPELRKSVTKEWLKKQGGENWDKAKGIRDR